MDKNIQKIDKDKTKLPVLFQKVKNFETEDTRFTSVKIWLCHDGINHHWSEMSKQVIEEAIPTLANTPILGYIEKNGEGEDDFSDHRKELDSKDMSIKYKGSAIGVIGSENNAKFETRLCDDGIEREYLTVEGLLWNKLEDSISIMDRDVIKSQSMELHDDSEGYVNDDNIFVFTKIIFYGSCVLGVDHQPAMESSTIELMNKEEAMQFTAEQYKQEQNKITEEISSKMDEFNKHFSTDERSGDKDMSKQAEETVEEKVETEEVVVEAKDSEATVVVEEFAEDDKKKKEPKEDKKSDDSSEVAKLKKQIEDLKAEIAKLKGDVDNYEKAERKIAEDELFAKYTELNDIEEFEALKSKSSEFSSLNDLEKEIALVFVKNKANMNFTKQEVKEDTNQIKFDNQTSDDGYGGLLNKIIRK